MRKSDAQRLIEIREEMGELLDEAKRLLRSEGFAYDRARAYWIGHISQALGGDLNEYVGSSMCSFHDTLREVGALDGGDYDDEDEDDG